jgi:glycosyltransferase involved in cell wall biosynthesis
MSEPILLSIIIATVNRVEELNYLLASIENQNINKSKIEVIIIDQNRNNILENIISSYRSLPVLHIRLPIVGLSIARNAGIEISRGEFMAFPDDDCVYGKGFFEKLFKMIDDCNTDIIAGWQFPIYAIDNYNKPVARHWRNKSIIMNLEQILNLTASAGIIIKRNCISNYFKNDIGAGTPDGACEDLIFLWENTRNKQKKVLYTGEKIKFIFHPQYNDIPLDRIHNYNRGHIKAWKLIYSQSNMVEKSILIKYITLSFLYHMIKFLFSTALGKTSLKTYHKFVFFDRFRLLFFTKELSRSSNTS